MSDVIIVQLRREKEPDILGLPKFSITGIRKPNWLDSLLFAIKKRWYGDVTDKAPGIFHIELPKSEVISDRVACALEVYPGKTVQDILWHHEDAKKVDYSK